MAYLSNSVRRAAVGLAVAATLTAAPLSASAGEGWSPLTTPAALSELTTSGDVLVLDIRSGAAYASGHVPGAVSAPYGLWRGPKENPGETLSDDALTELLQSLGVERDTPTIVTHQGVDETDFGAAARVYWTLKASGVSQIAILNGGVNAWFEDGLALSTEATTPERSAIVASLSDALTADRDDVAALASGAAPGALVDARPLDFYLGVAKHGAAAEAGTLAGAGNLQHDLWFGHRSAAIIDDGERVRTILARSGAAPEDGGEIAVFCNTGHWAATTWFALSEIGGVENVTLYPGSMVDWTGAGGETQIGG